MHDYFNFTLRVCLCVCVHMSMGVYIMCPCGAHSCLHALYASIHVHCVSTQCVYTCGVACEYVYVSLSLYVFACTLAV